MCSDRFPSQKWADLWLAHFVVTRKIVPPQQHGPFQAEGFQLITGWAAWSWGFSALLQVGRLVVFSALLQVGRLQTEVFQLITGWAIAGWGVPAYYRSGSLRLKASCFITDWAAWGWGLPALLQVGRLEAEVFQLYYRSGGFKLRASSLLQVGRFSPRASCLLVIVVHNDSRIMFINYSDFTLKIIVICSNMLREL